MAQLGIIARALFTRDIKFSICISWSLPNLVHNKNLQAWNSFLQMNSGTSCETTSNTVRISALALPLLIVSFTQPFPRSQQAFKL